MNRPDQMWVVYQGAPIWDGEKWVNGDRFFLSGPRPYQGNLGVELARGMDGLELPTREDRFDTDANNPGATYVSSVMARRTVSASVNILGDTAAEMRRNKARWIHNHQSDNPGRLWFITSNGEPRYMSARPSESAGSGSYDTDPNLRRAIVELEWGWVSDSPYFFGYKTKKVFKNVGEKSYRVTFFNPSTAPRVYPNLFLPGPGQWEFSLGYQQPTFRTPTLNEGDVARLDYDPRNPTFMKRDSQGTTYNLWPSMVGSRPKLSLEPMTKNTLSVTHLTDSSRKGDGLPYLTYTPEFLTWM